MLYETEMNYEPKITGEEGNKEGLKTGRTEGELLKLIKMVAKKALKGKSISVIASELEETEDSVKLIYDTLAANPGAVPEEILIRLQQHKAC
ncbi:MAG: hypothetical protein IJ198_03885 [Lachnospiraceae bacterium]|nr:hypothetical protein [Lachnospiraceae bacterium]